MGLTKDALGFVEPFLGLFRAVGQSCTASLTVIKYAGIFAVAAFFDSLCHPRLIVLAWHEHGGKVFVVIEGEGRPGVVGEQRLRGRGQTV